MYPPYWVSSKEGTFHLVACFFITLIASARRRSIYLKLPQAGRVSPAHPHCPCLYAPVYKSKLKARNGLTMWKLAAMPG